MTLEEMLEMDVRMLAKFAGLATRERREGLRDMALAARVAQAKEEDFSRFIHDVMDETPSEVKAEDTWAELMWIGGR